MIDILKKPTRPEREMAAHKTEIILEMGQAAYDLLSPRQVREELNLHSAGSIPDLVRNKWLEPAPAQFDVGISHRYYRWNVELVRRHKRPYNKGE